MLKVGLTGGIGCGKSTVAALFQELDVPLIDADVIARQLVEPGQPALAWIIEHFGHDLARQDGSLDRAKLRDLIFADAAKKQQLENRLHPAIYQHIQNQASQLNTAYCVISIPLLIETRQQASVDRVLVVDCPVETQIARITARDHLSVEQAQAIIASQASRDLRLAAADDCLDNSSTTRCLAEHVKKLHNLYLFLATNKASIA